MIFSINQKINSLETNDINEKSIKEYFKNYDKLSNEEKKEDMKNLTNSFLELKDLYERSQKRENILDKDLKDTTEKLENKYYPEHSLSMFALFGRDISTEFDCYAGLEYKYYFWEGRGYLGFGAAVKIYDQFGGAGQISFGYCWKSKKKS
jgi:alpha-amylase/alpha-mannosidase (GH57 family)